jgi:hypothetical protein
MREKIDLSDLSHSYPFLHLSRKFGACYDVVLALAAGYDAGYMQPPSRSEPNTDCARAVYAACRAPWRFDMSRASERGL